MEAHNSTDSEADRIRTNLGKSSIVRDTCTWIENTDALQSWLTN
jgi:hypothetical protein